MTFPLNLPKSPEPPQVSTVDAQLLKKTATVFSTKVSLSLSLSLHLFYYTATKFGDVHPLSLSPPLSVSVSHPSLSAYHVTVKKLRERERELCVTLCVGSGFLGKQRRLGGCILALADISPYIS
jgi:hypothetical protein